MRDNIIVVFPKKELATNIRNILVRNGFEVIAVCTTAATAIQNADKLDDGIMVCGYKMPDMLYTELREYLPDSFEMLLVASPDKAKMGSQDRVIALATPLKVFDLVNTIEMMMTTINRKRKKRKEARKNRDPEKQELVRKAKLLLMERNQMTEGEAHRYLQKCSMDSGNSMSETAEMVLSIME